MQNLDKYTSYYLLDKYYPSDSFTNGRKFKGFFSDFAKKLFEINLKIQKGIGEFPIAIWRKNSLFWHSARIAFYYGLCRK